MISKTCKHKSKSRFSSLQLVFGVTAFLVIFDNVPMFRQVFQVYPPTFYNIGFIASLIIVFACVIFVPLSLTCFKYATKPILSITLLVSAATGYFAWTYGTVMNADMIANLLQTDVAEASELVTLKLFFWVLGFGVVPSFIVIKVPLRSEPFGREVLARLKTLALAFVLILFSLSSFGKGYASFFREHKPIRMHANPTFTLYSIYKYMGKTMSQGKIPFTDIAPDVAIPSSDVDRELVILVVGESVRADHLSLNGYPKETMPYLSNESVISFPNVWACGTSTATSLPCMFSFFTREEFNQKKADSTTNVLDVLAATGVHVLWRDNNSDSKHVALRLLYQDFKTSECNDVCDIECRDEGMLNGLQDFINSQAQGDILIVLHQMGNHGPAYWRRYPPHFEIFTPVCDTSELQDCSVEEINNAYDNALVYTDYFLSRIIDLLKNNDDGFETALVYFSDHGESLGEHGIFLHGFPFSIAPAEQTGIAAIMWFGSNFHVDVEAFQLVAHERFSHDNLSHTLLGLFEAETEIYEKELDMTAPFRREE